MRSFPSEIGFTKTWRSYQGRVLGELDLHLDDNHLHVIAAPGSGKTVLGLEVVLRLGRPALIFAPTIAIRDQWVDRLVEMFCPAGTDVSGWISRDVRKPKLLTVSTYQGLHSAYTGKSGDESDAEDVEEEDEGAKSSGKRINSASKKKVVEGLKEAGVGTIVVDEAHHLRREWWKCLIDLKEGLGEPVVVALTATPPLDVGPAEWGRYCEMCGPVDSEICVPELVLEENLCVHQDYVYVSTPLKSEAAVLDQFHADVRGALEGIFADAEFADVVKGHPFVQRPRENVEGILSAPEFCSAMAVYLNHVTSKAPRLLLKMLGIRTHNCPAMSLEWMEVLLSGCLYEFRESFGDCDEVLDGISRELKRTGAIERRQVHLRNTDRINRLLRSSVSKLASIEEIVRIESEALGEELRMVILTDFIRKEDMPKNADDSKALKRIGVVPIFETIRRSGVGEMRLGILSGSIVVVPRVSVGMLEDIAEDMGIDVGKVRCRAMRHDEDYYRVEISGEDRQRIVRLITRVFNAGGVNVLVGTKSLLGEGWDAPSINSLVLASFVGSYMLSNQMRGRAIRTQAGNPDKASNIWHLVCTELNRKEASEDLVTLGRRFKSFVGVSFTESVIENGIARLGIGGAPFRRDRVEAINEGMIERALDREGLRGQWAEALGATGDAAMVEEVAVSAELLPRRFVIINGILAVVWQVFFWGMFVFAYVRQMSPEGRGARFGFIVLAAVCFVGAVVAIPKCLKAWYLFVRHRSAAASMKQVGVALLKALVEAEVIQSRRSKMGIRADELEGGGVSCSVAGATTYEKSLFLDAMGELLGAIDNPRYLILRKSRLGPLVRKDYRAVPTVLGRKKETAEYLARMWSRHVGGTDLFYTRSKEGKTILLKAKAISATVQKRCERVKVWK